MYPSRPAMRSSVLSVNLLVLLLASGLGPAGVQDALPSASSQEEDAIQRADERFASRLEEIDALNTHADYGEAEKQARILLRDLDESAGPDSLSSAAVLDQLADSLVAQGRFGEPETLQLAERSLAIREATLSANDVLIAHSLDCLANVFLARGDYERSRGLYERALALRETTFGPVHADVAKSLQGLAVVTYYKGDLQEAKKYLERVFTIRKQVLEPDDPLVAESIGSLAVINDTLENWEVARALYEEELAMRERVQGPTHPDLGQALQNMATFLQQVGDLSGAYAAFRRAIPILEEGLGPDAPILGVTLNNFGNLLSRQGRYSEARPTFERALAIQEKKLGVSHPDLSWTLTSLGNLYSRLGDYSGAKAIFDRALGIREEALGDAHQDVAMVLTYLGELLTTLGHYEEAEAHLNRALRIQKETLGEQHGNVARTVNNLALLESYMGNRPEALKLYESALAIRRKVFGDEHADVAHSLRELGTVLYRLGDYDRAQEHFEDALGMGERRLGEHHPDIAPTLEWLATVESLRGNLVEARRFQERALRIREQALGVEHPLVARSLHQRGNLLLQSGDYKQSIRDLERSKEILEKTLGPEHPAVAKSLVVIAAVFRETGDYTAAVPLLERALAIRNKKLGEKHPDVASAWRVMAGLYLDLGEYGKARSSYEHALTLLENWPDRRYLQWTLQGLGLLSWKMGDYREARSYLERALTLGEETQGAGHPGLTGVLNDLALVHTSMRDYATARELYDRCVQIREEAFGPEDPGLANHLNNLGRLLQTMGDPAAAMPLHRRAVKIWGSTLGPEHTRYSWGLAAWARSLWKTGQLEEAHGIYRRAVSIREAALGQEHPDVAKVRSPLATLLWELGETAAAFDQAIQATEIGLNHARLTSRSLAEREALRYAPLHFPARDLLLTMASYGLTPSRRRQVWDQVVRGRGMVLDEMASRQRNSVGSGDPQLQGLMEELRAARERLARLSVSGPGEGTAEQFRELLSESRRRKERAERALAEKSLTFRQSLVLRQAGLEQVVEHLPEDTTLVAYVLYDRHERRREAPQGTAGEAPSFDPACSEAEPVASYLAFVLRAGGEPTVVPLGPASEIDAMVERWREQLAPPGGEGSVWDLETSEVLARRTGNRLREIIWDPLQLHPGETGTVLVVPDGSVNLVSYAALPMGGSEYLVEQGPLIHYLSAERELVSFPDEERHGQGILAVGGPSFDETGLFASLARNPASGDPPVSAASGRREPGHAGPASSGRVTGRSSHQRRSACGEFRSLQWDALAQTRKEAREVVSVWQEATGSKPERDLVMLLTGERASETSFKQHAPGRRILHLATHGFFLGGRCASGLSTVSGIDDLMHETALPVFGENPLVLSGLVLAGANHRSAAGPDEDDGILTAEEIAALDLEGVEWAVLSACDTGLGELQAGEGVFGLRRAFQLAGARTLIMSLWEVEDRATRRWMSTLYEAKWLDGLGTAEAVREASLRTLQARRRGNQSTHPFFWGAFVATGDWR